MQPEIVSWTDGERVQIYRTGDNELVCPVCVAV